MLVLVIVRYETSYGGIFFKLHHHVCRISGGAVMSEQGKEGRAEHTPLWCACFQDQGAQCAVPNPYHLRPVAEEVSVQK